MLRRSVADLITALVHVALVGLASFTLLQLTIQSWCDSILLHVRCVSQYSLLQLTIDLIYKFVSKTGLAQSHHLSILLLLQFCLFFVGRCLFRTIVLIIASLGLRSWCLGHHG